MNEVRMVQGSVEYIYADIRTDRLLDTQAVSMAVALDGSPAVWQSAEWVGPASKFRSARILLDGALARGVYTVYARITDAPEAPIIEVGKLRIT